MSHMNQTCCEPQSLESQPVYGMLQKCFLVGWGAGGGRNHLQRDCRGLPEPEESGGQGRDSVLGGLASAMLFNP